MKLVPLGDKIVLKQLEAEETTKSGIVLPGQAKEKPQEAEVIAVGPGGNIDGKEVVMQVKVGEKVIYSTVGRYCDKDKTQRFIENIVRSFTIKNLIGQLTILNPDKIMGDVEETVSKLEILEDTTYSIDQKKMLYIHMCVMVERLILEKGRLPQEDMTDDLKCRESFIKNLKESFSVIENKYNVSLNEREILMIYYLTENN